jgi:glycosyltransferase involved in cell wall biosynthesis
MLKVGLDLSSEPLRVTGIGSYALALAQALGAIDDADLHVTAFAARGLAVQGVPVLPTPFGARSYAWRRAFQQAAMPAYALGHGVDLLHSVNNLAPLLWRGPTVLSIHDTKLYQAAKGARLLKRLYRRNLHQASARRADLVLTDSAYYKREIVESLGVAPNRVRVIGLGVDHARFDPSQADPAKDREVLERHDILDQPYVLSVATREPTKNLTRAMAAFAAVADTRPDLKLVLCGGRGWGDQDLEGQANALGIRDRVRPLGYVPTADLPALYRQSRVYLFPSLVEGFGFPILEAFSAGVPVVTSTTTACPETAGGAALLADPTDVAAIADALARALDDESLREDLVARGQARARACTWERCARETAAAYREAVSDHRGTQTGRVG